MSVLARLNNVREFPSSIGDGAGTLLGLGRTPRRRGHHGLQRTRVGHAN